MLSLLTGYKSRLGYFHVIEPKDRLNPAVFFDAPALLSSRDRFIVLLQYLYTYPRSTLYSMMASQAIDIAFAERPNIAKRIKEVLKVSPTHGVLFQDIAHYIQELRPPTTSNGDDRAAKKRKLDINNQWEAGSCHIVKELSFSIPQRKKFNLEIGEAVGQGIRARNPTSGDIEFDIAWNDIETVACVPVPDKAQSQYNFCVFLRSSAGSSDQEQILWTVPDTIPKAGLVDSTMAVSDDTYKSILFRMLNQNSKGLRVIVPDGREFASQGTQISGRKGEKLPYVKAFRGSKDGMCVCFLVSVLRGYIIFYVASFCYENGSLWRV